MAMINHKKWPKLQLLSLLAISLYLALAIPAFADDGATTIVVLMGLFVILLIITFIPTYVAFSRNHPNRWLIFIVNLAFGYTLVGWFVALIWALRYAHQSEDGSNGGESGLNIFVNDPRTIRIEPAMDKPQAYQAPILRDNNLDDIETLARLKTLFNAGAISSEEYTTLKTPIINRYILDRNATCPQFT